MHLAARVADLGKLALRGAGVVALPGVDACLLAREQVLHHLLVAEVFAHQVVEQAVEVRIAVKRIAAGDQPRDAVRAESNGRQFPWGLCGHERRRYKPGRRGHGAFHEVSARSACRNYREGIGS